MLFKAGQEANELSVRRARSAVVVVLPVLLLLAGFVGHTRRDGRTSGSCDTVSYVVTVQDTTFFRVRMSFRTSRSPQRLFLPENSPGGLREVYSRFIEALRVETVAGDALPFHRVGASTWQIDAEPGQCVDITYLVRRHLDDPIRLVSNDLTSSSGYFVGATMLLGVEQQTAMPARLSVRTRTAWSVWTTLQSGGESTFQASSYEEVAWAPVLVGAGLTTDIALANGTIRLVAFGAPSGTVVEAIASRFQKIARCEEQIFGFPAERQILVGLRWRNDLDYGGGVSRRNAIVMNIGREWMSDPGRFASGTFAHELFHTWNFGLFYPAETRPWQPFGPTATRLLWLVEGLSDYYVLQTFVRSGLLDAERALQWIGGEFTNFENSPARAWASLEDGGPMVDAGAVTGINVHAGGFVVAFVLDAMIRSQTDGRSSLDDVVRALAAQARSRQRGGYSSADVRRILRTVGGDRVAVAYTRLVSQPGPLDYLDYDELLQGSPYRVTVVEDSSEDAGRWLVQQLLLADRQPAGLSVLTQGCHSAP
jgi:predicted metalloprotease with PDZ domain